MPRGRKPQEEGTLIGLKVKCLVTGQGSYFGTAILKNKLEEFGTIEAVSQSYICRDAAKLLREGKTLQETREALGVSDDVPLGDEEHIGKLLELNVQKTEKRAISYPPGYFTTKPAAIDWADATKDTCFYPNIILNQPDCTKCRLYEVCTLSQKKVPKAPKVRKS